MLMMMMAMVVMPMVVMMMAGNKRSKTMGDILLRDSVGAMVVHSKQESSHSSDRAGLFSSLSLTINMMIVMMNNINMMIVMVKMVVVVMMKMMVVVFFFFLRTSPTRLDQYSRLPRLPCCYSRHHGDDLDDEPCVPFTSDSAGP